MTTQQGAAADRRSVASSATATATFYDALDQLTLPGSRFSFQTADETLLDPEEGEIGDGVDNGGFVADALRAVAAPVAAAETPEGTAETEQQQQQQQQKKKRRKQKKPKTPGRIRKRPRPPSADAEDDDDPTGDDFGFRYRPAIGPPRPLLRTAGGGGSSGSAGPEFHLNTVLSPEGVAASAARTPPSPSPPAPAPDGRQTGGDPSVHYYFDNSLLLSGRLGGTDSVPRCRTPGDSLDDSTVNFDDGWRAVAPFDASDSAVGATAVPAPRLVDAPPRLVDAPPRLVDAPPILVDAPPRLVDDPLNFVDSPPSFVDASLRLEGAQRRSLPGSTIDGADLPGAPSATAARCQCCPLSRRRALFLAGGIAIGCLVAGAVVAGIILGVQLRSS